MIELSYYILMARSCAIEYLAQMSFRHILSFDPRRLIVVSCGITKLSLRDLVDDQLYYSLIWKKSHISSFFPPFAFMSKVFTQVIVSGNSIRPYDERWFVPIMEQA